MIELGASEAVAQTSPGLAPAELVRRATALALERSTRLERIRRTNEGLYAAASALGLDRQDIALTWSFTIDDTAQVEFDLSRSPVRIPVPNDLALNPTSGLVEMPADPTASAAQREFNEYLSTLDGFPPSSTARLDFTAALDPTTVARGLKLFELQRSSDGSEASPQLVALREFVVSHDTNRPRITLTRPGGFRAATTYVALALAGPSGVRLAEVGRHEAPRRSIMMHLALSPTPLCQYDEGEARCTSTPITSFVDDPPAKPGALEGLDKATRLERLRRFNAPIVRQLEAQGIQRDDIIALWSFTIHSLSELLYDLEGGAFPYPNNMLLDPRTLKVNLPMPADQSSPQALVFRALNQLDGFNTQGFYFAPYAGELDQASVREPLAIIAVEAVSGAVVQVDLDVVPTAPAITITPRVPLKENTLYAFAIQSKRKPGELGAARGVRDPRGRRVVPAPIMAMLRSRHPLYDAATGRSTIDGLDDERASLLEGARRMHEPLFGGFEKVGIAREDLAAAWVAKTQSLTGPLQRLQAVPWTVLPAHDGDQPLLRGALDTSLATFPYAHGDIGAWMPEGRYDTWNVLDERALGVIKSDPASGEAGDLREVPFVLVLPKTPMPPAGWPVVVFYHGMRQSGRQVLAAANTLAAAGLAVLAPDIAYHGARSWCTEDSHCTAGACDVQTGRCTSGTLADRDGDMILDASGARFLGMHGPTAFRDNIWQHVVDAAALLRAIRLDGVRGLTGGAVKLDPDNVHVMGQSLGGMLAPLVLATDDLPRRGLLNVAAAPLARMMLETEGFSSFKRALLSLVGVDEGSLAYLQLAASMYWLMDGADPGNFARHVAQEPLGDPRRPGERLAPKQVVLQLAGNDALVPPALSAYFARELGVDTTRTSYPGQGHGFLFVAQPDLARTELAQLQAAKFLSLGRLCTPDFELSSCDFSD